MASTRLIEPTHCLYGQHTAHISPTPASSCELFNTRYLCVMAPAQQLARTCIPNTLCTGTIPHIYTRAPVVHFTARYSTYNTAIVMHLRINYQTLRQIPQGNDAEMLPLYCKAKLELYMGYPFIYVSYY